MSNSSNSKTHALYIILILMLLGGLIFTNVKLKKNTEIIRVTASELDSSETLREELENEYQQAINDLENIRAEKMGVDSLLNERQKELIAKKSQIAELIRTGQNNKADLDKARAMIKEFNRERLVFQAKIDSLSTLNEHLNIENVALASERDELTETITQVESKKEEVEKENTKLKSTVDKAKILSTSNISVTPIKTKSNKEREVKRAKQADALKLCFDLLANRVASDGDVELTVRMINPNGETIQIDELGSGKFTEATTGNYVPYTYVIKPSYHNKTKTVCSIWNQTYDFASGNYSVEVYQQGLLIGQESFSLK